MKNIFIAFCVLYFFGFTSFSQTVESYKDKKVLSKIFENAAKGQILKKWYPLVIDSADGGFFAEVTYDFKIGEKHEKMIVTQARHIWTNSTAFKMYPQDSSYLSYAEHGFHFLRDKMWDGENGGFYNLVTKEGTPILNKGNEKLTYGNAFAVYALAVYHSVSGNQEALELAKKTFYWLEENSYDPKYQGYFNVLKVDGTPWERTGEWPSTSDVGYKDQNTSIHLLEAFTELYQVWPDELLKQRLEEMLILVRDTITTEKGYLNLFFEPDWTPVSFKNSTKEEHERHYYLDHVSFGHDVETAFLMLEASHALGIKNDSLTLIKGKKMVDHALQNGWDEELGGFYDGGYYFEGEKVIQIINSNKNWWSQAEGLNTLLIMSCYFPEDEMNYRSNFDKLWNYIQAYIIDEEHGGWYEWGIDKTPEAQTALKGHIWKGNYHNFRALINMINLLRSDN